MKSLVMRRESTREQSCEHIPEVAPASPHRFTRRGFLATTALAAASTSLHAQGRQSYPLSLARRHPTLTGAALLPAAMTPESLRTLAATALEAARAAGADYADIRVAEEHRLGISLGQNIGTEFYFNAGIRVQVNGAWAFVHGSVPSFDTMASIAQHAVATAKGYAGAYGGRAPLAPAPVVSGEWTTPIQLDPFTVPVYDQVDVTTALASAVRSRRARGGGTVDWTRETRVFASTDGAVQTQTFYRVEPRLFVVVAVPMGTQASIFVRMLRPQAAGYECVTEPGLPERIKATVEGVLERASLPLRTIDVGRYPIVMDGTSFGATLVQILGPALSLSRALGDDIGGAGGSFLSPPEKCIGTSIAGPLLTVTADRAAPHDYHAVRWDDDGVAPATATLITNGRLTSYCASRQSAAALAAAAPALPATAATLGCALAAPQTLVKVGVPHFTVAPATSTVSVDDLCRDVSRGVLLYQNQEEWNSDPLLASGFKSCDTNSNLFEIVNGKVTHRLYGVGLQFATQRWLRGVRALGGPQTLQSAACSDSDGWTSTWQTATAPAALFRDIDVVRARFRL
jgi:TldD protein